MTVFCQLSVAIIISVLKPFPNEKGIPATAKIWKIRSKLSNSEKFAIYEENG